MVNTVNLSVCTLLHGIEIYVAQTVIFLKLAVCPQTVQNLSSGSQWRAQKNAVSNETYTHFFNFFNYFYWMNSEI